MGNNWTSQLEDRRNGLVPGFIGNDESIEDFERRHAAELVDERNAIADAVEPTGDEYAAPVFGATTTAAVATKARPAKKATAKKAASTTRKR